MRRKARWRYDIINRRVLLNLIVIKFSFVVAIIFLKITLCSVVPDFVQSIHNNAAVHYICIFQFSFKTIFIFSSDWWKFHLDISPVMLGKILLFYSQITERLISLWFMVNAKRDYIRSQELEIVCINIVLQSSSTYQECLEVH